MQNWCNKYLFVKIYRFFLPLLRVKFNHMKHKPFAAYEVDQLFYNNKKKKKPLA